MKSKWPKYLFILVLIGIVIFAYFKIKGEEEIKKQQEQEARHIRDLEVVNQKVTTEKVRAEAILRYLRSIGEAVFATDKSGTIVFSNEAAANMVGMKPEEILGEESQGVFRFCISDTDKSCDFLPFYEAIKFKKTL